MPAIVDDVAAIRRALTSEDDSLLALVDERFLLERAVEASGEADLDVAVVDQAGDTIARLDDEICGIIATSAAGVIAQIRVLRELGWGTYQANDVYHSDDCVDRLIAAIAAGVERLAAGA